MKKFLLSGFVVFSYILYSVHGHGEESNVAVIAPKIASTPTPIPSSTPAPSTSGNTGSTSTPAPTATPAPAGKYKNGQYTGSVADAYYGNIQVQATISGGKLTDVKFLQYPNDRDRSVSINQQAMPYLKQEAIAAQSATVDGVSGATYTSEAFTQSLGAALTSAGS